MSRNCSRLPISDSFSSVEDYVESLLSFTTSSDLFQTLCGGVHILDFFTREPDVYTELLPGNWRAWFNRTSIEDILDLLMRRDLEGMPSDEGCPPSDLLEYIRHIRRHSLRREYDRGLSGMAQCNGRLVTPVLPTKVAVGMKPKKKHEVQHFASYVDRLASENAITHLIDFGSGQNYLGRTLASQPYNRHVIAIEGKESNIQGAQLMDYNSKVTKDVDCFEPGQGMRMQTAKEDRNGRNSEKPDLPPHKQHPETANHDTTPSFTSSDDHHRGSLYYVNHRIENGDLGFLASVIRSSSPESPRHLNGREPDEDDIQSTYIDPPSPPFRGCNGDKAGRTASLSERPPLKEATPSVPGAQLGIIQQPRVMVISLHSCGNLIHHGLRSLLLNDFVAAVAMIGCCYNLMTERLGPPTYKLPSLRFRNARVVREGLAYDPHGFPMSQRLSLYNHKRGQGIRFNITARMMAVQAPQNWTPEDSSAFFTRHFFRALLQRIFFDRGVVRETCGGGLANDGTKDGPSEGTEPIIIGSLRAACYRSFRAYVRGAVAKLPLDPERGSAIRESMDSLSDEEIDDYERRYQDRKKDLCVVWSLMAFSAGLVEACIVADRWLFLGEQREVDRCWVEPIFDYKQSPRNLVVVGIKRS